MARVLFVGDPHLKINRFDLAITFLTWLNKTIDEQQPDLVVNLGDTFDTHAVLRSEVLNEFMKHVYHVLDKDIPYVYLVGNHDMYKPNDPKYHAMRPFKGRIPNFHVIDEVTNMFDMTFVPYQHDGSKFPKKTLPIVVAHQTFLGADYGPIRATEGVDAESIEGCEIVISGHIHTRSNLGRVLYVGSPFSQSASDVDQIKGITIFDSVSYSQSFVSTELPTWRRIRFVVSQKETIDVLHREIMLNLAASKDHWVVEIEGPQAEIVGYLGSRQYLEVIKDVDVKVKTKFTDKEKKKVSIEAKSMEYIVSEYISKVYNGSLDKEELRKKAQEVRDEQVRSKLLSKT